MSFTGKCIIVTGSNSGIGKATALLFASKGASVLIHGRNIETLKSTVEECKNTGTKTAKFPFVQESFEEKGTISNIFNTAMAEFGKLDILVNNAGETAQSTTITGTEDVFHRQINSNLKTPIFLSQLCFPELKKSKGNIVNVSSMVGTRPCAFGYAFYAIAKAALNQFTQCAGIEYGSEGVRVNAICPGYVKTPIGLKSGRYKTVEEWEASYAKKSAGVPVKKVGTPDEVAKLIAFVASDEASMMNGVCIVQDGGHTLMGLDTQTIENAAKCS